MRHGFYIIHYSIHVVTQKFQMSSGKVVEKRTIHTRVTQKTGQVCTIIIYGLSFLFSPTLVTENGGKGLCINQNSTRVGSSNVTGQI